MYSIYERAWNYPQYEFLKDLSLLRDDTSRMVMIKDDLQGMYKQPDNYLNIEKWKLGMKTTHSKLKFQVFERYERST